jgi:GNAT superfamily N-acetyltransferase
MRIRVAEPGDAPAMSDIALRAYAPFVELIDARPHPMDDDYAEKIRDGIAYVADDSGVAGLLILFPREDHLLLENVAVDPDRQGRGIGRALLDRAERSALELGFGELRLYTNAAMTRNLEMYARRGYREEERRTVDGFNRVFLRKPLAGG